MTSGLGAKNTVIIGQVHFETLFGTFPFDTLNLILILSQIEYRSTTLAVLDSI